MTSVFDILDAIEKRPSMYVGASNAERGTQLRNLEMLLGGYALAVQQHDLQEPVKDFPREFAAFLHKRFGWSAEAGPVAAIRDASQDDEDAWQKFWALTKEFRKSIQE